MKNCINKTIKFYEIIPQPTISYYGDNIDDKTYAMFKTVFPEINYYKLELNNSDILMEILEYTDKYLFAKCSKVEGSNSTNMLQVRNTNTNEAKPLNLNAAEQLETYTFLYIDFKNNIMAVLSNKKISKINEYISTYIHKTAKSNIEIFIPPLKIRNIRQELKKYNKISALKIKYAPDLENSSELCKLKDVFNGIAKIKNAKIRISLQECNNVETLIDRICDKFFKKEDNWEKFELVAQNDIGLDEVINFYESIYIRKVPIKINELDLEHFSLIRDRLQKEINNLHKKTK